MYEFLNEQQTFRKSYTDKSFISTCDQFVSCAPYIIARTAQDRVADGAELLLPEGVTDESLDHIRNITGQYFTEITVTPRQAVELQDLGRQILALNENGKIEPPLTLSEKKSVAHLVDIVGENPAAN